MTEASLPATVAGDPRPPRGGAAEFGLLRGEVSLTVQTRQAGGLITGRPATAGKPAIIGLLGFAERLKRIWQAAAADDPYADWWLIRIEAQFEAAAEHIRTGRERFEAIFDEHAALAIQVGVSARPYRLRLRFASPHAYSAANLIGEFDQLARRVLTAEHVGLIDRPTRYRALELAAKPLRRLLAVPLGFRSLGFDRARLKVDAQAAGAAREAMGQLPPEILTGERLPCRVPRSAALAEPLNARRAGLEQTAL